MLTKNQRLLGSGITLLLTGSALANTASSSDVMVVTASGFEQKITNAPASISVLTREELEQKRYNNLAEALSEVEGIDVRGDTGKTGGLNISIRGMPSDYTLILIDGRRQNAAGNVTPNGFGETSTSFMPPLSAIERIEVIRGPMSTLYGSDAMGGVVNIITRKVAREWTGSMVLDHTFQENKDAGSTSNLNLYTSGPLIEDKLGIELRGSLFERGASKLQSTGATTVDISTRGPSPVEADIYTLGTRLSLTPNSQNDIWLDLDQAKQRYDNGESQLGTLDTDTRASGYKDTLHFNRQQAALGHTGRFSVGVLESSLMYKNTETLGRTIATSAIPERAGEDRQLENDDIIFDTKFYTPIWDSHMATVGGQWWKAEMKDGLVSDKYRQTTRAVFAEDEWQIIDDLTFTGGLRYDDHDAFGGHYSPRAYLVWNTTENWTLKGGVGRGYKTPSLNALHSGVNGISGQGTIVTIGNPDLKPEVSTNTEFGVYYNHDSGFNANATLFHNKFKDKIASGDPLYNCDYAAVAGCITVPGAGATQETFSQDINIDEAVTQGVELASTIPLIARTSLKLNYTYTDSEQKSGTNKGLGLTNVPRHMANGSLNWQATERITAWLRAEYRSESDRFTSRYENLTAQNQALYDAVGNLKGYTVFHLGGAYKVSDAVTLNATIYNLFDKDFLNYQAYEYNGNTYYASQYSQSSQSTTGMLQEGRRLWISTNITF